MMMSDRGPERSQYEGVLCCKQTWGPEMNQFDCNSQGS